MYCCNRRALLAVAIVALAFGLTTRYSFAVDLPAANLESGYRQMYNLEFSQAHQTFGDWQRAHPQDPLGPVSNAAAYLFAEFDRLHILEVELFTDNSKFEHRDKLTPDAGVRTAFETELAKTDKLADAVLVKSPNDRDALFAKVLAGGLRGDYLAMIEKRNLAGLSYIKAARSDAEKLVAMHPSYYDAYLAMGVENYLLGTNAAPVRWMLRMTGAQTDKQEGIEKLRLTAEKGRLLAPYARLLLAVAALRDKDNATARNLLSGLAQEFPQNHLYQKELARLN
ncbi:MAG: hypothetical protein H0X25_08410 [Acidobacteriales bacterium]|nr:hypothetical protein [Terriglobales bacterium]